jgi:hypothetical protein
MGETQRSIFRERAMQHYLHKHEQDVLPRSVSPALFLFLWIALVLLLVVMVLLLPEFRGLI